MFGLEKGWEKREEEKFDLEKEMEDPKTYREIKTRVEERIQTLKKSLREGESKEEFDQLGTLLHAYAALQKLMSRITQK